LLRDKFVFAMEIVIYRPDAPNPALERIRSRSLQMNPGLIAHVTEVIEAVRSGGDEALIDFTRQYDGVSLKPEELRVDSDFIKRAARRADQSTVAAFRKAIQNVRAFHEHQIEASWEIAGENGEVIGQRIVPIAAAGLYVPGGAAAYPSTVVMNVVPAQVAKVPRIAISTPPATLDENPMVAAIIGELGVEEIYRVGGAHAIAALAFGTETVQRVDKIVGPGNIYVAVAKKLVYGTVGIDSIAGPTEVVVLADETADPAFVAADMLAQAEHDREASAICITTSATLGREVARHIDRQLAELERREIATASIQTYGVIFIVESIEDGCKLVNLIAPEHLELLTGDNDYAATLVENAGAIFYGPWSPEPVGDYLAGPNHVLPTVATARFSSPLGVYDFLKRQSIIRYNRATIDATAGAVAAMADSEGLTAHRRAILMRLTRESE
jgi:histidinol dehydrogenase